MDLEAAKVKTRTIRNTIILEKADLVVIKYNFLYRYIEIDD